MMWPRSEDKACNWNYQFVEIQKHYYKQGKQNDRYAQHIWLVQHFDGG